MRVKRGVKLLDEERIKVEKSGGSPTTIKWSILTIFDILEQILIDLKKIKKMNKDIGWTSKLNIVGLGKETKLDIESAYPNEESLIESIKNGERLPFNNLVERKLKEYYK